MSSASKPFVASWGIIGCGWISSEFVQDICRKRDDVKDVAHAVAACGSRDKAKAQKFIDEHCPNGASAQQKGLVDFKPASCGSYDEVYNHPNVTVIYIGTPNTSHYIDTRTALEAGKHVLLEKPATLNAAEWKDLCRIAKGKGLFLMEALWTRFLPLAYTLQDKLFKEKVIGDLRAVHSDFSMQFLDLVPDTHRVLNLKLAGGPMLDLGPYIVVQALMCLYHHPDNQRSPPENVQGSMLKARTGVDLTTSITMDFPKIGAKAFLSTSAGYNTGDVFTRISGTKGHIVLPGPNGSQINKMIIKRLKSPQTFANDWEDDEVIEQTFEGFGLMFEADAVARSLQAGELENARMPHDETLLNMEIFDKVRKDGNLVWPEGLEQVKA